VNPAASLKAPSPAAMAASVLSHEGRRKQILKAAREVEVCEKIKEHVAAILTALVDDMTQGIKDEVANDPRIQKRCMKPRRQLEKEIIRQYQREMSERRKEKLAVYNFVTSPRQPSPGCRQLRTQRSVQRCRRWAGEACCLR
jgi:hypothetical protein